MKAQNRDQSPITHNTHPTAVIPAQAGIHGVNLPHKQTIYARKLPRRNAILPTTRIIPNHDTTRHLGVK